MIFWTIANRSIAANALPAKRIPRQAAGREPNCRFLPRLPADRMPGMSEERKKPGVVFQICAAAAIAMSMLNLLEAIFFPVHEIDRRLRPSVWDQHQ